jgi:hypothetical protein
VTVVETPPQQQPSQDELEALIEEARRRARRRRLAITAAALAAVAITSAVAIVIIVASGRDSGERLRDGFHAVQARGPVQHARLVDLKPSRSTISVATGRVRPTRETREVWWDPRSGLYRTVYREDGIAVAQFVQQGCQGSGRGRFCFPPSPFDLAVRGLGWPPKTHFARQVGTGTFRGRPIVWIEGLVQPGNGTYPLGGEQVAYDAVAHQPLALRSIVRGNTVPARWRGRVSSATAITMLPNLPAKRVSFAVPDGGAPRNAGLKEAGFRKATLARAREVLGRAPLWLGTAYRGHRLRFVQTARSGSEAANGGAAGMVPFVRLDYGTFRIDEFGDRRPLWFQNAPRAGTVLAASGLDILFGRDGVVLQVVGVAGDKLDPALVLALVKALRLA